ncbi:helix-turn-helix domain-containing protein [Vibrio agarivorans]|uniref:Helix-turn-helix transcriptional regulator n=1 Tax=Vibrio agarivorans TaxID=153622 RepID=A0ABT7XZC9_9VIBR|nr:helix-turn-helix transcriptional regulator [Vibrio agarivorans]MDN2481125.1 helix-turn-helix transcriptional regulator [Vibrio agarivorans]
MSFTNVLLDRVKTRFALTSDYQLAKKLGCSTGRVSNWRTGRNPMDWEIVFEIADMLELDDQFVVQNLLTEKYKNPRLINALRTSTAV